MKLKSPTNEAVHVALLSGHAIAIGPEGRVVPHLFRQAAFIAGAVPLAAYAEASASGQSGRNELIKDGIKKMLEDGGELTSAGLPNRKALSNLVGFTVEADELGAAWAQLEAEAAAS